MMEERRRFVPFCWWADAISLLYTLWVFKWNHMSLEATKPVFGVSAKAILKLVSSATVTSYKIEISLVASLDNYGTI